MKPILWIVLLVGVSVASSKLRSARQVGTTCSAAGKTRSDTSCCGNLFYNSPAPGLYEYYASDKELAGTCCRNGFTLGGSTFTLTPAELEANSPEGGCYCDDTAPECHTAEETPEKKEADSACCGQLFEYYSYYYFYTESPQEKSGTCSRTNPIAGGQFLPISSVPTLPGKCYCDASETACFAATAAPEETTTTTEAPDPCTIDKVPADNPACCGNVFDYRVYNYDAILYYATEQEKSLTCCRTKPLPFGTIFTTAELQELTGSTEATVGDCYCNADEASCVTQPTTTPGNTTTAEASTTTTPELTTTTTTTESATTTTPEATTTTTPELTTTTTPEPTTTPEATTTPAPTTAAAPAPTTAPQTT